MNTSLLFKRIGLFVIALVCFFAVLVLLQKTTSSSARYQRLDFVSTFEERAKVLLPFLANETSIGYFFAVSYEAAKGRNFAPPPGYADGEAAENSARGSLMNYAMRPYGAIMNLEEMTDILIVDFIQNQGKPLSQLHIRSTTYLLVQDFGNGLSIYRRQR